MRTCGSLVENKHRGEGGRSKQHRGRFQTHSNCIQCSVFMRLFNYWLMLVLACVCDQVWEICISEETKLTMREGGIDTGSKISQMNPFNHSVQDMSTCCRQKLTVWPGIFFVKKTPQNCPFCCTNLEYLTLEPLTSGQLLGYP